MFLKVPGDAGISYHKFLELWPIVVLIEIEFYFTSCLAYIVLWITSGDVSSLTPDDSKKCDSALLLSSKLLLIGTQSTCYIWNFMSDAIRMWPVYPFFIS
jgi:hypothetical protein